MKLCDQFLSQQFQQRRSELVKVLDDPMVVGQVLLDAVVLNTYPDHLDSRFPHPLDSGLSDRAVAGVAIGEGDADLASFPAQAEFAPCPPKSMAEPGAAGTGNVESTVIRLFPETNHGEDVIVMPLEGGNRRADAGNGIEGLCRHETGAGSDAHLVEDGGVAHASGTVQKHADSRIDCPFFLFPGKNPSVADTKTGQYTGIQSVPDADRS